MGTMYLYQMTDQQIYDTFPEVQDMAKQISVDLRMSFDPGFVSDCVSQYDPRSLAVRLFRAGWRKFGPDR